MGSRTGRLALVAALLAVAVGASAAWAGSFSVLIRHTPNMTRSNRTARTIDGIVIHATEGRFVGSVRWLAEARSRGSAHFVVSRRGQVVQLVPVTDVAWHSGNAWWNLHSIGIEHEGWTKRGGFTEPEYRASAELVAYLAHRWGIPLDRRHIIGHAQVPNPRRPGHFGGVDGHVDPGPHWNWTHYMALVRHYAAHPVLPHFVHTMTLHDSPVPRIRVTRPLAPERAATTTVVRATPLRQTPLPAARSVVDRGATVHGSALWWSGIDASLRRRRRIYRVDFLVDGKVLYTDNTWPFAFHRTVGWNTETVANGSHLLVVRAYGARHYRLRKSVGVRVRNAPIQLNVSGAETGAAVAGTLDLSLAPSSPLTRVALYVDGTAVSRDSTGPYSLAWDSTRAAEGPHTLLVYGRDRYGHRATESIPVVVANAPTFPQALANTPLGTTQLERDEHATAFSLAD